ncbi:hypothetical protein POM88_000285 [Heracleum sosnowskyi]|uniref:DC1 domain-containing protein n=1 Tax=Heracleum sosnowskyi TaxID=360622 RepID=A0AAD8N3W0_9APIA|nr:hypothetical protein POM88_000285 [Heracleum sosnowskyi]
MNGVHQHRLDSFVKTMTMIIRLFLLIHCQKSIGALECHVICALRRLIRSTGFITVLDAESLHTSIALYQQQSMFFFPYHFFSLSWLLNIYFYLNFDYRSGKYDDLEDVEGSNLVHLPISDNQPDLLYQLIQQFAKEFNTSTAEESRKADKISQCRNGHPLILFDNFNNKNVVETSTGDKRICDGCVQPLLSPPNPFYGCPDCNFFLHTVCATELPREIQHALHPGKELARLTTFYETRKPLNFYICCLCEKACNGILYSDGSDEYCVDIGCAALPSKIKHDIDPNYWFYHCRKCDTSFHTSCVDQNFYTNIKYGGIVKDESLHEHSLQIIGTKQEFKCGKCGRAQFFRSNFGTDKKHLNFLMDPFLKCVSCKFFVCMECSVGTWSGSLL